MEKIKIFLVDDHAIVREGISKLLSQEKDFELCGEAVDVPTAVEKIKLQVPQIVIVDISLSNSNGLDLIKSIKSFNNEIKILVFSMHDETVFAERSLRLGASGYLMKNEEPSTLIKALRKILNNKIYLSEAITDMLLSRAINPNELKSGDSVDILTDREFTVFQLIGEGKSSRQISENLNLSIKTVESHKDNIKHKLNIKNATELTQKAVMWMNKNSSI